MKVLLSESQLQQGVAELAYDINQHYGDQPLTIIGLLTGSIVLMADLIRQLKMPLRVGVLQASSYHGTRRGEVTIDSQMMLDIDHRDVLIVDDIFDTGHTLKKVKQQLLGFNPTRLQSAVLLVKSGCQQVDWRPEFIAFEIPDEFVVGYGLDYNDNYRNLPYLACLEPTDIDQPHEQNSLGHPDT